MSKLAWLNHADVHCTAICTALFRYDELDKCSAAKLLMHMEDDTEVTLNVTYRAYTCGKAKPPKLHAHERKHAMSDKCL